MTSFVLENKMTRWTLLPTFGHDQSRHTSGSDGGANGIAALVHVDLAVPAAPGLCGGKHAATTAHVAESSLAGAMGTSTTDTRDTCNSTPSAPGLSRGLVT